MRNQLTTLATLALVSALTAGLAQTTTSSTPSKTATKKKPVARRVVPKKPSVESQIQSLRDDMQTQIQQLKQQLSDRDQQLQQAQQAAAAAQAAATQAQQEATQQNSALTENSQAVSSLQGAVTDLKANSTSIASTIQEEQSKVQKAINHPDTLHYKGITLTPGGFVEGATIYRTHATGGDIPTAFNALPYEHGDAYSLSEFFGSARQSRVSLMAEGKAPWGTMRGYYEADWLGTGISSNGNQSNSYVMRQRVIWAQAALNNGWAFTGGQLWSLATEDKKGISNLSGDILLPLAIDPNYVPGFVWTRQFGFRVTKTFKHLAFGVAAENPQLLYSATLAGNTPYAVLGSAGANGGNYNAAISNCSPSTTIVNYTNQVNAGVNTYVPVYKTTNSCANVVNYSFNVMPDFLVKVAIDPSPMAHFELFGIGREAHETVYPGETTNSNLYGGLKDIVTGATVAPALTTAGAYHNNIALGGLGASGRVFLLGNKLTLGLKGLYGAGMGRYGTSTLSDVTSTIGGELTPLHNLSAISTVEVAATKNLVLYANYGGDYASRNSGSGTTLSAPSVGKSAAGVYGGTWAAASKAAVGYGSPLLNNSACLTNSAPGFNGSSTGYYPGGSCGAQTKDVQELSVGYWFDFYRGEYGRLRQGIQYGYASRQSWTGAAVATNGPGGVAAKGTDNMFWTSFRYYLP